MYKSGIIICPFSVILKHKCPLTSSTSSKKCMWHLTPDTWHLTPDTWHIWQMVGVNKISAPQLLRFGIDSFLTILNERITQSMIFLINKVFIEQPRIHQVCSKTCIGSWLIYQSLIFLNLSWLSYFLSFGISDAPISNSHSKTLKIIYTWIRWSYIVRPLTYNIKELSNKVEIAIILKDPLA